MTQEEISAYFRDVGRKGGKASAAALTPEQRSRRASAAARARWDRMTFACEACGLPMLPNVRRACAYGGDCAGAN